VKNANPGIKIQLDTPPQTFLQSLMRKLNAVLNIEYVGGGGNIYDDI
jgi:hypothetical protein